MAQTLAIRYTLLIGEDRLLIAALTIKHLAPRQIS